jgi:acyl-CoA thioester hydrolase
MGDRRASVETRSRYRHFLSLQTRWADNDLYGHVNNVTYYSYFDSVVNRYLVDAGGLDIFRGQVIGVVVETMCRFVKPLAFPEAIDAGLRIRKIGTSSVRYEVGVFRAGEDEAAAHGYVVHVFVERATNKPVPVPAPIREALGRILASG